MRIAIPLLALLMACGPDVSSGTDGGGNPGIDADPNRPDGHETEFVDAAPPEPCAKMDILFVIDDSGSMSEEQGNLATNFPQFIQVIHDYQISTGELLDYHVGAITTGRDMDYTITVPGFGDIPFSEGGDNGELLTGSGCGMPRRWLQRSDGDASQIADIFSCVAEVGTGGPSIEMPFYTTQLAFTTEAATNEGFLREDALLAMVILTDEDDCSRTDNNFTLQGSDSCNPEWPENISISDQLAFLDNLKDARGRWAVAAIAGPNSCSSDFGEAIEAVRLKEFVAQTGANGVFSSICDGDLSGALSDALDTFDAACDSFPPIP